MTKKEVKRIHQTTSGMGQLMMSMPLHWPQNLIIRNREFLQFVSQHSQQEIIAFRADVCYNMICFGSFVLPADVAQW